jgi:hypothetical protein
MWCRFPFERARQARARFNEKVHSSAVEAALRRISEARAIAGPLEFNTASVELQIAINGLERWLSQHATEEQLLSYEELGLAARALDNVTLVHAHIRQVENASSILSGDAADVGERRTAYCAFEKAGRYLAKRLRDLEEILE